MAARTPVSRIGHSSFQKEIRGTHYPRQLNVNTWHKKSNNNASTLQRIRAGLQKGSINCRVWFTGLDLISVILWWKYIIKKYTDYESWFIKIENIRWSEQFQASTHFRFSIVLRLFQISPKQLLFHYDWSKVVRDQNGHQFWFFQYEND